MAWADISQLVRFSRDKLQKVAIFESERMLFDAYCLEPGQAQKPHAHDDIDKVYVVLSGEAMVVVGEEERRLGQGEAAFAPAGRVHGVRNEAEERATLLVFQARPGSRAAAGQ